MFRNLRCLSISDWNDSIGDELSIVTCADIRVRSLFDEGEIFFKQEFDQPCFLGTLLKIAKAYMPLASETC